MIHGAVVHHFVRHQCVLLVEEEVDPRNHFLRRDVKAPDSIGQFGCRKPNRSSSIAYFVNTIAMELPQIAGVWQLNRLTSLSPVVFPYGEVADFNGIALKPYMNIFPRHLTFPVVSLH